MDEIEMDGYRAVLKKGVVNTQRDEEKEKNELSQPGTRLDKVDTMRED